jgi:hypothetical protein
MARPSTVQTPSGDGSQVIDAAFKTLLGTSKPTRLGPLRIKQCGAGRSVVLAYDEMDRKRRLVFHLSEKSSMPRKVLVRTKPLRLVCRDLGSEGSPIGVIELLQWKQSDSLFSEFISNVLSAFTRLDVSARDAEAFIRCVEARIIETEQPRPFSDKEQTGLMGELHVLENDLIPLLGADAALRAWKGPLGKAKDFDLNACCIEVKATKASKNRIFHVNSESQFVKPEKKPLFLAFYVFDALSSGGRTVADRYLEVRKRLTGDLANRFDTAIRKAGYIHKHRDSYKLKSFAFIKRQFFRVESGFPIIRLESLNSIVDPGTIREFEYAVGVAGLGKFEIPSEGDYKNLLQNLAKR